MTIGWHVDVHPSYLSASEDGTDRVFRNVGIQNSDAGELHRRRHTTITFILTFLCSHNMETILFHRQLVVTELKRMIYAGSLLMQ